MEVAPARPDGGLSPRVVAITAGALTLALLALVTASVLLGLSVWEQRRAEAERQAVLHAARQEAVNLLTIDYRTLDRDVDRILDGATGTFRDQYATNTGTLQRFVQEAKASTKGSVQSAGVVSMDGDSAEVLLVADQQVNWAESDREISQHFRLSFTMQRKDDRWLVSKFGYVG